MEDVIATRGVYVTGIFVILLVLTVIFIVYVILMNLFLIVAIMRDPNMRKQLFFQLILLIALAHLLQGLLVIPLHVEFGFNGGKWTADSQICTIWHITDLTLTVVLATLLLMLVFERFFSLTYPQIVTNKCLGVIMLLSPWVLSTAYVVFLYYALPVNMLQTVISVIDDTVQTCSLDYYVQGVYSLVGFLLPASFIFGFSWANIVILCLLKRNQTEGPYEDDNPKSHTITASLIAFCFIVMWFPTNSVMILPDEISRSFNFTLTLYLGFANAALTPSLWLILPVIKRGFHRLCCCCVANSASSPVPRGGLVSSAVDESQIRMLGQQQNHPPGTAIL